MNQQDLFASTQMISIHPILKENIDIRAQYFTYLRRLIRLVKWDKRKYTKAQIAFYKKRLCESDGIVSYQNPTFNASFSYLMPLDLAIMVAFHQKVIGTEKSETIISQICSDFHLPIEAASVLRSGFDAALGSEIAWNQLLCHKSLKRFRGYLEIAKKNALFLQEKPYNLLITATMSAGKSTLINALVGKNITLAQNMACTSKIHTIVSKPFEDGISSEYDHDIAIDATKEDLMDDNEDNKSSRITVGTYFDGLLGGERIMVLDSPGVNASENADHTEITEKMLRSRKYNLLIYVLNATQLGTTDEERHLEIVAKNIGRTKIIFAMNKIDHLISEDDALFSVIQRQRAFLISKGFKNPIICPVSSRAAFVAKKSKKEDLSRIEGREFDNYADKFEQQSLSEYYADLLNYKKQQQATDEVQSLLANCGFTGFETMILNIKKGDK